MGTFTWEHVTFEPFLAAVSDAEALEIPARGSAELRLEARMVHPLLASISPAAVKAGVSPADAIASLEAKTDEPLGRIGTRLTLPKDREHLTSELVNDDDDPDRGRFLYAVSAKRVKASFSVVCTEGRVQGQVTTWSKYLGSDSIRCGIDEALSKTSKEAEQRSCTT
ncbi:hypothetical protein [Streptomyces sp. NPDC026673]|uniref:hypothetical protein n=1 Tax=Streptomyces sp. NPDC026673 TaxID=3155724 RepID=UPI0033DCEACE